MVRSADCERHFRALGLAPDASPAEVKQAYRDLALVWHPDRFASNLRLQEMAQEKFRVINAAYEVLRAIPPPQLQPRAAPLPEAPDSKPNKLGTGMQGIGIAVAVFAFIMAAAGFYHRPKAPAPPRPAASYSTDSLPTASQSVDTEPAAPRTQHAAPRPVRAVAPEQPVTNGESLIEPRGRFGAGFMTVRNQTEQDAVASLVEVDSGGTLIRMVYVSAGQQATINGIWPGVYRVALRSGAAWSRRRQDFTQDRTPPRSAGPFAFTQIQSSGEVRGDHYGIILRDGRAAEPRN